MKKIFKKFQVKDFMRTVRDGGIISLNAENIGCGGGKFYTGFTEMPEHVPTFVSLKEKYKQTPEQVIDYIEQMGVSTSSAASGGEKRGRSVKFICPASVN